MLTFKFGLLGHGSTVKIGQGNQVDRARDFGPCTGSKWAPVACWPNSQKGDRAQLGNIGPEWNLTGRQNRWHKVKRWNNGSETPISMETEPKEPIRSTAKASMDRSVRSEITTRSGIVLGHLFLGLRNVVKTVMKTWPCNEQLLGRGPLQRTHVNTWEAQWSYK